MKLSIVLVVVTVLVLGLAAAASGAVIPPPGQLVHPGVKTRPDLMVVSATPTSVTVWNVGAAKAGPFAVRVEGGLGSRCWELFPSTFGMPAVFRFVPELEARAGVTIPVGLTSIAARNVTVDFFAQVRESDEQNNSGVVPHQPCA